MRDSADTWVLLLAVLLVTSLVGACATPIEIPGADGGMSADHGKTGKRRDGAAAAADASASDGWDPWTGRDGDVGLGDGGPVPLTDGGGDASDLGGDAMGDGPAPGDAGTPDALGDALLGADAASDDGGL